MYDKEKELVRRLRGEEDEPPRADRARPASSAFGGAAADPAQLGAQTQALAADFDWKKFKGKKLKLLLNKHPYADAMIADLDTFKTLTGMDVNYDIFPEDVYFDKVTAALSSRLDRIRRLHDRRLHDLDLRSGRLDRRPQRIHQGSGQDQPELQLGRRAAGPARLDRVERRAGRRARLGRRQAVVHSLGLRAQQHRLQPEDVRQGRRASRRRTWPELVEIAAKLTKDLGGPYGIGVRGSRSWATIHPGFLSGYSNFGAAGLHRRRRQAEGRDEHGRVEGLPQASG